MADRMQLARALLGGGVLGQAADSMRSDPAYQEYASNEMMEGRQPMPRLQWMQLQQQQTQ